MLSQQLIDFYNGWTKKAIEENGNELSSIYNKFITLFITYNNLYNQVPTELVNAGIVLPRKLYDNKKATEYVIKYIGATNILSGLYANNQEEDINAIIDIINNETFYIKLHYGQRQRHEDLNILNNLRSTLAKNKATAILEVLYNVRCNMFHGHKEYTGYQRVLIQPLSNILLTVNRMLFNKLNA